MSNRASTAQTISVTRRRFTALITLFSEVQRNAHVIPLACIAGLSVATQADVRAEALLHIDRAVWTDDVNRDTRNYTRVYKSPIRLRQVYLWVQLRGTPQFLEQMKRRPNGRIPIRHHWFKYDSDGVRADLDVTVNLEVGRKEVLHKLAYQVNAEGFFSWRVWSRKERLTPGWWRVDIAWETGEPILCRSATGEEKPCSFLLEVK